MTRPDLWYKLHRKPTPDTDFEPPEDAHEPSADPSPSPRKRRRIGSADLRDRDRRAHLDGQYRDAYRVLFNEAVNDAAARFAQHDSDQPESSQFGASIWSAEEQQLFFGALERLGKDDIPGIARAVGTKSIPETREFLLILRNAAAEWEVKPRPRDAKGKQTGGQQTEIAAAIEIGGECERHLELAGDALAWYQERDEAKQELERHGRCWLITPEIAEEVEDAIRTARLLDYEDDDYRSGDHSDVPEVNQDVPEVIQDIPEAKLLVPEALLWLSKFYFMNPHPAVQYPWPHWTELASEIAREPSIYRTAFSDFYRLVVSLTKRLVQAAIIQATSRIRSQGLRVQKGSLPFIKRRDALAAIDILGLKRNARDRWRGVARRCGLRVLQAKPSLVVSGRGAIEVPWDEVEQALASVELPMEPISADEETAELISGTGGQDFKARAVRSGTPLPTAQPVSSDDSEEDHDPDNTDEDEQSDAFQPPSNRSSESTNLPLPKPAEHTSHHLELDLDLELENENERLEDLDRKASGQEEQHLLSVLGISSSGSLTSVSAKRKRGGQPGRKLSGNKPIDEADDWRSWTRYHAEWEEFRSPLPASSFLRNQKQDSPARLLESALPDDSESSVSSGQSSSSSKRNTSRAGRIEIPVRGARAYAAMQERFSLSEEPEPDQLPSDAESRYPVQSVEGIDDQASVPATSDDDGMDWDAGSDGV
ncbi:hypothetical protein BU26DRAFT_522016 [Trematosphaeria pertusa]|uniref:Myb-like domain-containing protein n=1 Tax=Trematosphaeria pertusa TaxID=390896 RepID=A0A6A6I4Y7_9PLEO|nr:uncharacterized protein BU26DRAFT_522016 [Trematosphaeria pertusa]KAF2245604.1 hypothetical protein BU26DRAFT_522016 [Trematosphaeria pertusa]